MLSVGAVPSKYDPALFRWYQNDKLHGLVAIHVDDFLYSGSPSFLESVIVELRKTFRIGKEESTCFQYLGIKMTQINGSISMDQSAYTASIVEIQLTT